jgi:hypothetical protein
MEIDFQTALREKYDRPSDVKEMVLSTCADNHVTSRLVSVACFENLDGTDTEDKKLCLTNIIFVKHNKRR